MMRRPTMPGDLDAAIRAHLDDLDNTRWDTKGQQIRVGDVFPEATAALREVLKRCAEGRVDPDEVVAVIADELGVRW